MRLLGPHVFRVISRAFAYEVSLLIFTTSLELADLLLQSGPSPSGDQQELRKTYDVTMRSLFIANVRLQAAIKTAGAVKAAYNGKVQNLRRLSQTATGTISTTFIAALDFKFVLFAFDTLGARSS